MKAAVLTGIRQMKIRDVAEPKIEKDTDVLLKIEVVGVCGSDVHYYETGRIGSQVVQYPFIVGHECSATVKAVGDSVTRVKAGDQVVVEPAVSCHECDQCRQGRENTCDKLRFLGTPGQARLPRVSNEGDKSSEGWYGGQGDGCLCEYIVMPEENCFPTNGTISLEQAALCEPFAIGVYSVKQSRVSKDSKIAILGAGPIGLSCLAAARAQGVETIYVTDKLDYRVDIAKRAGAAWAGNPERNVIPSEAEGEDIVKEILQREPLGMDIVYECAGQQETLDEAVELLKPGGKLMLIGIPRVERVSFSIDKLRRKESTLINVRRQNKCTQKAIDLIAEGSVDIDFMITHRFKLEQTKDAFDLVAGYRDGVVKVLIGI